MQADLVEMASRTPPGMAGVAGTGPRERTCRECGFWAGNRVEVTEQEENQRVARGQVVVAEQSGSMVLVVDHSRRRWVGGSPVQQACMRFRRLRRGQMEPDGRSRRVAHDAPSCSHFAPYGDPQPLTRPADAS